MPALRATAAECYATFPLDRCLDVISELTLLDRYQASTDLNIAADRVAGRAEALGLHVELLRYPADGSRRWWGFSSPRSWTPVEGALDLIAPGRERVRITSYPEQPCSIATYSTPSALHDSEGRLVTADDGDEAALEGSFALLVPGDAQIGDPAFLYRLEAAGCLGVVASTASHSDDQFVARVELPPDTRLIGFSVIPDDRRALLEAARQGGRARARVVVDRGARMPVVSATLKGSDEGEVWLLAHLCHPRPGANDNASGVAASLGVAELLARSVLNTGRPGPTVRFVWMPEIAGTAAYLHTHILERMNDPPIAAVDLDMVGENQALCGGPMVLEHAPDHLPATLNRLASRSVWAIAGVDAAHRRRPWNWTSAPFRGLSDHALLVDPSVGTPAVEVTHYVDRFNHSSADDADKVDPSELRRCAAAAATIVEAIRLGSTPEAVELRSGPHPPADAWAERDWAQSQTLGRGWDGPLNVRDLVTNSAPADRHWFHAMRTQDRLIHGHAQLVAFAIDGTRRREDVVARAVAASRGGLAPSAAARLLRMFESAGFAGTD